MEPNRGFPEDFAAQREITQIAVRNDVLEILFDRLGVQSMLQRKDIMRGKHKADLMEVLIADLDDGKDASSACSQLLRAIGEMSINEAISVKRAQKKNIPTSSSDIPERIRAHHAWLKTFQYEGNDYTHSSLRGGRDKCTSTGKLKVPDDRKTQVKFARAVTECYEQGFPCSFVEMSTTHYPYVEDLDIEAQGIYAKRGPPDGILHSDKDHFRFWKARARILHGLFPRVSPLVLHLFTASGFNAEKQCPKTSFHCVWPDLIVDRERAHQVRLQTIDEFVLSAETDNWTRRIEKDVRTCTGGQVLNPDGSNDYLQTFNTLFDITGVRAKSLRMVFNDKVLKPR
jgi:hypothetical protein